MPKLTVSNLGKVPVSIYDPAGMSHVVVALQPAGDANGGDSKVISMNPADVAYIYPVLKALYNSGQIDYTLANDDTVDPTY